MGCQNYCHPGDLLQQYMNDENMFLRWKRMVLFLQSGSPVLIENLKKTLIEFWCQTLEIQREELTKEQRLDLVLVLSGMTSVLKFVFEENDPSLITSLMKQPLGQGILATMASLPKGV